MKYMLLLYADESKAPQSPEEDQAAAQSWYSFNEEAKAGGVLLLNNGLDPVANATTVRVRAHKRLITDGPFAETHEQLGGYYMLDGKDLDEAIRWTNRFPQRSTLASKSAR